MSLERSRVFRLADAQARIPGPAGEHAVSLFDRGTLKVKLSCPVPPNQQAPHDQDEVYLVVRGRGVLLHDGKRDVMETGDCAFVAAGTEHRFEDFTGDLAVWVLFFGPEGGDAPRDGEAPSDDGATFRTRRVLPHPPAIVFDAFARPETLARWWGPAGFTNTFEVFEFKPGGRWKFVMHGPDGSHPKNESVFVEVDAPSRLVIHHVSLPRYVLTVTLDAQGAGTAVTWVQRFEDKAVAARIRHIVEPANEQNLDRLQAVLAR